MNKIKVLHLDSERGYGGGQRQLEFLLNAGKESNFVQAVACKSNSKIKNIANKLDVVTFDISQSNSIDIISAYKLKKAIELFKPDIVHAHTSKSLAISFLQKIIFKSQRKVVYLNTRRVSFPLSGWFTKKKYMHGADFHICISKSTLEQLEEFGIDSKRLIVIHSGVKIPKKINRAHGREKILNLTGFSNDDIIIGTSGNLLPVKRFDWIVEAFSIARESMPNVKLIIFGDGKGREELNILIKKLNIENHVYLAGHVDNPEDFFFGLDVFSMTSKVEGLGSSLIDAMARSTPLLGSNTHGIRDVIKHKKNGLLFDVNSRKDLLGKLMQLLSSKKIRKNLTKDSYNLAKNNFGIENTTIQNLDFYKTLISCKPTDS
jgi:glycosyltransferase involved in cell wall biosynthesis